MVRARQAGLAGATVLRGSMGFGQTAHMRAFHLTDLSPDLPIVIEIVDAEDSFWPSCRGCPTLKATA